MNCVEYCGRMGLVAGGWWLIRAEKEEEWFWKKYISVITSEYPHLPTLIIT
jgi:hypothetical protein